MNKRPDYCRVTEDQDPCLACGATKSGNDPVRGLCQARYRGAPPNEGYPLIILTDKATGKPI